MNLKKTHRIYSGFNPRNQDAQDARCPHTHTKKQNYWR